MGFLRYRMTFVVRLVRGEWKKDDAGCFEHVSALEGFTMAVRLRETDDYKRVVNAVKERLALADNDDVELSYQWPQWMMGPDWKRANPIDILDDEDMTLFMAIRADLEEVHLRVKVIRGGMEKNVNSFKSHLDLGGLTSEEISDKYWNSAETRCVWNSALTRLLTRNAGGGREIGVNQMGSHENFGSVGVNVTGGIRIQEPTDATTVRASIPNLHDNNELRKATADDKGKGKVTDETVNLMPHANGLGGNQPVSGAQTSADAEFEAFRRNYVAEMWRDVCATEMTLGGLQAAAPQVNEGTRVARSLDFRETGREQDPVEDDSLRLSLSRTTSTRVAPTILTLSSSDSSYGTPSTQSTSISFSTEDLMEAEIEIESPVGVIGTLSVNENCCSII
ncbi:uncharacterized protein LOC110225655 [Arabidopsis lyrata subsp. lyrata]|uniref:uncharacterized protein LOC110225655 n=1 Tax=Arabidopsis lyrata subsp. lyrata TaxID=81972 RepID=UPI000A29D841|nr:uncharacterized protein LOC110225655 [Arabidopsis lyrata subsp. lyrata]|eukprot:XP_020871156.1 uncharacterized protein LOC110225655 [Arabidopsis lyrata subsp. lyrata]